MTVAQLIGGTVSNGLTSISSEWNTINRMMGSFCSGQPRGPPNFVALVDRKRLSHGGVFRHCSLATNHETMSFPSRLARQRKHNFSVVSNQLSSDCGVHSSSYVGESSTVEEHCLTSSMDVFTENPNCQPHVQNVKRELIMLSLPAIAGQAIEPLAQLMMETAFIGRLDTGECCQRESGNGKPFDVINTRQQLSSVSTALVLAAAIGIFEALALSLGSGLFLRLMGLLPDSSVHVPAQ